MSDSVVLSTATPAVSSTAPVVDTIEVGAGEVVTFDDLERVEQQSKAAKRHAKDETKDVVKETVKAMDKVKGGKDGKDSKDSEESSKEAKESKEKDSKKAGDKEAEGKLGADKKPAAKIAGKLGDKAIELEPDTLVPVKINGKEEYISIKDLQSQHSGRVAYDKKFQEMDAQHRSFEQKVGAANAKIKAIFEEADPEMRFYRMAEFAGQEPMAVRQKFLDENMKLLEKYYGMSEDERNADAKDFENKVLKHKLESQGKMDAERKSQEDLNAKISAFEKTHQVSSDDFWKQYDQIVSIKEAGKLMGADGKPIKVTPEFVAETVVKERLWNSAAGILDNTQSDMTAEKRSEVLSDLVDASYAQGLSAKQIGEIADELWGQKSKVSAIEDKVQEQEEMRTGKKSKTQASAKESGPVFFDELF